jgi:NitT/TauT family transport system substrate-binding protein
MGEMRLTRRSALRGLGALALTAACAPTSPGATTAAPSAAATVAATAKPLIPMRWLFGFTVQANPSMPVILAKEQGFFREQGLDVSWDFTTDSSGIRLIGTGQYQAGSVSDVLTIANFVQEGIPLKAIVQQSQNSARAWAVRAGEGIKRPKDFQGKRVGIRTSPWTEYLAMLSYDKVDRSKITEVPIGFAGIELKNNIIDVMPTFKGVEPFLFKNTLNMPFELIYPEDFGYPPVGTTMMVNTNFARENPDAVLRFVKAFLKGAEFFLNEKEKTLRITQMYAGPGATKEQHEFIWEVSAKDIADREAKTKGVGWLSRDRWQEQIDLLSNLGVLKTKPKVDDLIDTTFVEKALKDGKLVWP